jgi:CrcB protein
VTGFWIALAGAGGALARFEVDGAIKLRWSTAFPWPTFLINVSGSLLFGILSGLVLFHGASGDLRLIAGTGFCGGYTTFSTASFETVRLIQERKYWIAAFATLGTITLTLAAAALGVALTQL